MTGHAFTGGNSCQADGLRPPCSTTLHYWIWKRDDPPDRLVRVVPCGEERDGRPLRAGSSCSRHHFRIIRRDSKYQVERLNARNPTYLDGQPVWRLETLRHGSSLQAGHTLFRFLLHPQDEAMAGDAAADPVPAAEGLTVLAEKGGLLDSPVSVSTFTLSGTMVIGRDITPRKSICRTRKSRVNTHASRCTISRPLS